MSEPNPYEPPREPEPLTTGKIVKRSVAVATIILLTPPAMVIAVLIGCSLPVTTGGSASFGLAITIPLAVLTALMLSAAVLDQPKRVDSNQTRSRVGIFVSIPIVVIVAGLVGYVVAAVTVMVVGQLAQDLGRGLVAGTVAFFVPPSIALLTMLWLAWRAR